MVWELSLFFCLWVSLEMKPHLGGTAVLGQFGVTDLFSGGALEVALVADPSHLFVL